MRVRTPKLPWGGIDRQTPEMYLEQATLVCLYLTYLLRLFWISSNSFILFDQCRFFYFWDRQGVYSPECARRLCYVLWANFHLKQKQRYTGWSFTENANFISFYGKIWVCKMVCFSCQRGWRGWRACVGRILAWVACEHTLLGWCASVDDVVGVPEWVRWLVC